MAEIKRTRLRTKQDLIADSREAANALFRYADLLPDEVWLEPTDAAGWNLRDHIAHVAWWDISDIARMRDGVPQRETLAISEVDWSKGIDTINEGIRTKTIAASPDDVRTLWRATQADLFTLLESYPEKQYQAPAREVGFEDEGEIRLIDVLADFLGSHYREHLGYITEIANQRLVDLDAIP
ncbi:MAG: DinB family protein [Thermomicrobiales bacterium]